MPPDSKIAVIVNPRSASGRTAKEWPRVSRLLESQIGPVSARFTERQGHATRLARELLQQGADLIIAAGGDGTFNEVANGFIESDELVRPAASLAILPMGTGGDFRRSLGLSSRNGIKEAVSLLKGAPSMIDVGKIRFVNHRGSVEERYFINLVSFGMGGSVAARAKNFLTPLGGKIAFLWATLLVLLAWRGREVTLRIDPGGKTSVHRVTDICVGNGQFYGGGMHPCPTAVMDDGVFEVTVIDYMNMFRLLGEIRVLYSGNIYRHPKTHHLRGVRIDAQADTPTFIQIDGEPLGRLPAEVTILPRRLPVITRASAVEPGLSG
jgi:YegS/Rv2252/BmrU family lipid kinase